LIISHRSNNSQKPAGILIHHRCCGGPDAEPDKTPERRNNENQNGETDANTQGIIRSTTAKILNTAMAPSSI